MKIRVFQQFGSAEKKVEGITRYGKNIGTIDYVSIDVQLPEFVDDPESYIISEFQCDLVLNYLKHPDLSHYLQNLCEQKQVPIVSAGKSGAGLTPFTCCGLGKHTQLGEYGNQFGMPEYKVGLKDDKIANIEVIRGAPCGATWDGLKELVGKNVEEVLTTLPRQVQYFCVADPSGFDPVTGKSQVHYAGHVHVAALKKALTDQQNKQ